MSEYTCPSCRREMSIVFLGDGTAYDECECGTLSEMYDTKDIGQATVQITLDIGTKEQWESAIYGSDSNWLDRHWPDVIGDE